MQNATINNLPSSSNDCNSGDVSCNKTLQIIIIMICILGIGLIILFALKFRRYKFHQNRHIIVKVKAIRIKKDITQHQQIIEEVTNPDKEDSKLEIIEINSTLNDVNNDKPKIITFNNIHSNNSSISEKITSKIEEHKTNEEIDKLEKIINIKTTEYEINQDVLDIHKFMHEKGFSIFEEK